MKSIVLLFCSFLFVFLLCESSERMAIEFEKIDVYMQWDWYKFPSNVQSILPMIIARTQNPVVFQALGEICSNRETFRKVTLCR